MKKFMSKKNLRGLVGIVLIIALLIGAVAIFASLFGSNTKQISSSSFAVGGLGANGEFRKTDKSLYSKEAFMCQGLKIEKAFESKARYEVYYYREDLSFIGVTDILTDHFYEKGNEFPNAVYARVVITPQLEADEKLSFLNKGKYAREFKITVSSDQTYELRLVSAQENVINDYNNRDESVGYYHHAILKDGPFEIKGVNVSGKTIKKISMPISGVKDHLEDSKLTIYVAEKIPIESGYSYKNISKHEFIIPAMTFSTSLGELTLSDNDHGEPVAEENWITWDVNISLKDNQTLVFGDPSDSVYFSYRKDPTDEKYYVINNVFNAPSEVSVGLYIDIKYLE